MMTGYRSKRMMSESNKMLSWQDWLGFWQSSAREKHGWADSDNVVSDCMDQMQKYYPGKYTLEWREITPMTWRLTPVFADPKHETLWKIQYES